MAFPDSFLQELVDKNDIVDVVSGYVKLSKRTGSNVFGLCPFHSEKTPSFAVRPDRQSFHCFGCGKGGSVIQFVMEIEHLNFQEAVHFLAKRGGLTVPEDTPDPNRQKRLRMLNLNRDAARHFYENLKSPVGKTAISYMQQRKIPPQMVKSFGIGVAPDRWDDLIKAMLAKGYTQRELLDAGLAKPRQSGGGCYDTFRNRLMFPVIDVRGEVIGFSGRILGDGEPKYLNSPETLVFQKSRHLFGMNLAKKSKSGYIILTEGNIDVVALHSAGFDSAVASLGTALTEEQARLISRYTSEAVLAYDEDEAGRKASQRAINIMEKLELRVRVLRLSGAKDPDEYIQKNGRDRFQNLLEQSENHIEYRLQSMIAQYNLEIDEEKVSFLKAATELISSLHGTVEREVYILRVAELAGVSRDAIESEVRRLRNRRKKQEKRQMMREVLYPAKGPQPKQFAYDNPRCATAEEGLIRVMFQDPELALQLDELPDPTVFSSPLLSRIYAELRRRGENREAISIAALSGVLAGEEISHLTYILEKPETQVNIKQALEDYIRIIKDECTMQQTDDLNRVAQKYRETKGYGGSKHGL